VRGVRIPPNLPVLRGSPAADATRRRPLGWTPREDGGTAVAYQIRTGGSYVTPTGRAPSYVPPSRLRAVTRCAAFGPPVN
jgi:hypothetical protein